MRRFALLLCSLLLSVAAQAAFPTGWGASCALTIDHTKISGAVAAPSNFPVLVAYNSTADTAANLPAELMTSGGAYCANADGSDIRFTSDSAGTTPLHSEVVAPFTLAASPPTGATAVIWVMVPTLSTVADTVIYVWYHNSSATMPAADDATWGSQGVWDSNFVGVWHLNESGTGAAGDYKDSTSNANNSANTTGQPTQGTGAIGKGQTFASGSSTYIDLGNPTVLHLVKPYTVSAWVKCTTATSYEGVFGNGDVSALLNGWSLYARYGTGFYHMEATAATGNSESYWVGATSVWHQWFAVAGCNWDATDGDGTGAFHTIWVDTVGTSASSYNIPNSTYNVNIGRCPNGTAYYFTGTICEVRVSKVFRFSDWRITENNNQASPATFWKAPGTPVHYGGVTAPTDAGLFGGD